MNFGVSNSGRRSSSALQTLDAEFEGLMNFGVSVHQISYVAVSPAIGMVMSERLATLHELQTVYGCRDLYKMYEVACVNRYNNALIEQYRAQNNG